MWIEKPIQRYIKVGTGTGTGTINNETVLAFTQNSTEQNIFSRQYMRCAACADIGFQSTGITVRAFSVEYCAFGISVELRLPANQVAWVIQSLRYSNKSALPNQK